MAKKRIKVVEFSYEGDWLTIRTFKSKAAYMRNNGPGGGSGCIQATCVRVARLPEHLQYDGLRIIPFSDCFGPSGCFKDDES